MSLSPAKDEKKIPKKGPKCANKTRHAIRWTPGTLYSTGGEDTKGGSSDVGVDLKGVAAVMVATRDYSYSTVPVERLCACFLKEKIRNESATG